MVQEAHRRGLWQVFGILLGAGWGLLRVFDLFIERIEALSSTPSDD